MSVITVAPQADATFAGWDDVALDVAVVAAHNGVSEYPLDVLRAEQDRRDRVHAARANAQVVLP